MDSLFRKLIDDEAGFIVSTELVLVGTVLVLGLIVGLTAVRDAVIGEFSDVADSIGSLNQSYVYTGMHGCFDRRCGVHSWTTGSCFVDLEDASEVEEDHHERHYRREHRMERSFVPAPRQTLPSPVVPIQPAPLARPPVIGPEIPPAPAPCLDCADEQPASVPCPCPIAAGPELPCPCVNLCGPIPCACRPDWRAYPVPWPIVW
jgi:hypothetical protein